MALPVLSHSMIEALRATIVHGGVSAGADSLGMSQSSISRIIGDLQRAVGFPLFVKDGRTVKPTADALALLSKVQQSFLGLDDIARFADRLLNNKQGRLSICALPALAHSLLPRAIIHLTQKHPKLIVNLTVGSSVEVVSFIRSRQVDIGFAAQGFILPQVNTLESFGDDCVCICGVRDFPERIGALDLDDLAGKKFIMLKGAIQKRLESYLAGAPYELSVAAEVSHSLSASDLVLEGFGIAIVDPFTGLMHRARGGVTLPLKYSLPYKIHALVMNDFTVTDPVRDLLLYFSEAFGNR
jgi:DNA-binding transcriptional LysR family regulator